MAMSRAATAAPARPQQGLRVEAGLGLERREAGILFGGFDFVGIDLMIAARIGSEQGLVGDDVDAPREAFGNPGDHPDRFVGERVGTVVAGGAQAEFDIGGNVCLLEQVRLKCWVMRSRNWRMSVAARRSSSSGWARAICSSLVA
jgi:hypothetical protein